MKFMYQFMILIVLCIGVITGYINKIHNIPVKLSTHDFKSIVNSPINDHQKPIQNNKHGNHSSQQVNDETRLIGQLIVDYDYDLNKSFIVMKEDNILSINRLQNPCLSKPRGSFEPIILTPPVCKNGSLFSDGAPMTSYINLSLNSNKTEKLHPETFQNHTELDESEDDTHSREPVIDETRSIEQLVVDYGYSFEKSWITTDDDYILSVYQIINPCLNSESERPLDPIILGHPITQDGSIFIDGSPIYNPINCSTGIANGPLNKNLGFLLADLGFVVYLPSFRGFRYSRNHTVYDPLKDMDYWDFSFDEMGKYDAPAIINFALNQSTYSEVIWIGHSLGVAVPLVLLATESSYEAKIKHIIGLAPTVFMAHTLWPSTRYLADSGLIEEKKTKIGPKQEMSSKKRKTLIDNRTSNKTIINKSRAFFSDYGYDPVQTNVTRLPVFYSQSTKTSLSTYNHFAQLARSSSFKAFDGGSERNLDRYDNAKPPLYKISKIQNVTFTILGSRNDKVANYRDVKKLVKILKAPVELKTIKHKKMNHYGFLWAFNRDNVVNDVIIEVLKDCTSL